MKLLIKKREIKMNKINKTIILLATAVSFYTPTSFANAEQFYVKANAGYFNLLDTKSENRSGDKGPKLKSKGGSGFFGIGVGYNLTEKLRADLMFDYFTKSTHKTFWSGEDGNFMNNRVKGDISTLTVNGYFDFFESDNIKLFAGAGLGMSQTKGKLNTTLKMDEIEINDETVKLKTSNNFTYALHIGASAKVADNLHTDLTYSWRDFGDLKSKKNVEHLSMPYKGHHISLGLRYDI